MRHVLELCPASQLLGYRLALRGPSGSIMSAVQHLAESLSKQTHRFVYGLTWFVLSIIFHGLRVLHPIISVRRTELSDPVRSDPIRSDPVRSDPIRSDPVISP